jgi:hypothetical protein
MDVAVGLLDVGGHGFPSSIELLGTCHHRRHRVSITEKDRLDELSNSLRAADCQDELR